MPSGCVWAKSFLCVINVAYVLRTLKTMGTKCLLCSYLLEFPNGLCGRCCYYLCFVDEETEA